MTNDYRNKQTSFLLSIILASVMLLASFALLPANISHAQTGSTTSEVSVNSVDQNGTGISGYYTVLYDSSGSVVNTGFTPYAHATTAGQTYSVEAQSYGNCAFAQWSNGVSSDPMTFTAINSTLTLTAVYNCGGTSGGGSGGSSSSPSITVNSIDQSNNIITGYYVILTDSSGSVISTGYTPKTFATTAGQAYGIEAESYGNCTFKAWATGSTSDPMTVTATSSAQTFTAVYNCGGTSSSGGGGGGGTNENGSTIVVNSQYSGGGSLTGMYVLLQQGGNTISSGFTQVTFSVTSGQTYSVTAESYTNAYFYQWSDGVCSSTRTVNATASQISLTAEYTTTQQTPAGCSVSGGGSGGGGSSTGITVTAHRIPASYWAACFATTCTNPLASCDTSCTGPGASMYFVLYDATGNVVATGFADESGHTISGLTPGATYYVYPSDCDLCHGSTHDVVFQNWGTSSGAAINATRPIQVVVGETVNAWYTCTNGCS